MNALYSTRQDNGKITVDDFIAVVANMPGSKNLKERNVFRASAEADYVYEDDQTIIRLDEDQQMIAIAGIGKASIQAAYEIQRDTRIH